MKSRAWSSIGCRLFIAFSAFIALYAFASLFALIGIVQIHDGLERTRARVEGMRVALDLASAVRDQYAHLAHTIIIGNESHRHLHESASAKVRQLTSEMRRHTDRPDEQAWVSDIEKAADELDGIFNAQILPDVLAGRAEAIQLEHQEVLRIVARIQENTDHLARRFEESIVELQAFVSTVEQRAFTWSLLFLLVAPLVATWVGIAIGRSVARPVARLSAGAARLAAGDLDTRIDIESKDELGALAAQFNAMTSALKDHQAKLIQSEKLAGIGRLAAGVAHEINNPLGVILGYTHVLKKKADLGLSQDLGVIEEETLRCKEIIESLLDLSRPLTLSTASVDLREVCDGVAMRLSESGLAKDVAVEVVGGGAVNGDAPKLRQIVFNLMKNGVEAAGAGGKVEVKITETGEGAEVSVSDSGAGIASAVRERLFEPFFTTKARGTGLGLAVSRAIATAHGGEIAVDSTPGAGARFSVRLPRALALPTPDKRGGA